MAFKPESHILLKHQMPLGTAGLSHVPEKKICSSNLTEDRQLCDFTHHLQFKIPTPFDEHISSSNH